MIYSGIGSCQSAACHRLGAEREWLLGHARRAQGNPPPNQHLEFVHNSCVTFGCAPVNESRKPFSPARKGRSGSSSSNVSKAASSSCTGDCCEGGRGGCIPPGRSSIAPATSPPSRSRSEKSFALDTPSTLATASRCPSSGSRPAKKGRQSRFLKAASLFGNETDSGGGTRVCEPPRGIREAEIAMLVLHQLADDPVVPPDIENAFHGPRLPKAEGGGLISITHPSADRT